MPLYSFRIKGACEAVEVRSIGFYHVDAAVEHARRIARAAPVELWSDANLIGRFDVRVAAPLEADGR